MNVDRCGDASGSPANPAPVLELTKRSKRKPAQRTTHINANQHKQLVGCIRIERTRSAREPLPTGTVQCHCTVHQLVRPLLLVCTRVDLDETRDKECKIKPCATVTPPNGQGAATCWSAFTATVITDLLHQTCKREAVVLVMIDEERVRVKAGKDYRRWEGSRKQAKTMCSPL